MSSTHIQSQLCTANPSSSCIQCHISFRLFAFLSPHVSFNRSFLHVIASAFRLELIPMVFTTDKFFEVAIESLPEWKLLYPRPLNSVETLLATELPAHESNSHAEPTLYTTPILSFVQCHILIRLFAFVSRHIYFNPNFL